MTRYRGRFAPTPSGPLHLGSLLTALASFLEARARRGLWLLRMDDLDRPRCEPGADRVILQQLRHHGLQWDGEVRYQSRHESGYRQALQRLDAKGCLYPCTCTRAQLARDNRPGPDQPVYSGRCRANRAATTRRHSLRMSVPNESITLKDGIQGRVVRQLSGEIGDVVVRRSDGQPAYQLACVVDEHAMQVTEVVRGTDLLGSTFQQLAIMQALGLAPPAYRHLPVLVDARGRKLSKQNHAAALDDARPAGNLRDCLAWLGQPAPPPDADVDAVVAGAIAKWAPGAVPPTREIPVA